MSSGQPLDRFFLRVIGREENVRPALLQVRAWLKAHHLPASFRGDVELVLAEVLNNIVEHALPDQPNDVIFLNGNYDEAILSFSVVDHGAPMPGGQLPQGKAPSLDVMLDDLPEGGFGWMLVRELTSGLEYHRSAGMNHTDVSFETLRSD